MQIFGGFGLSATIENHGNNELFNVNWCVGISGPLVSRCVFEGVIESLPAQSVVDIDNIAIFGFGPVVIRVTAEGIGKVVMGFVVGPFLLDV